jgi:hypothetical protein
MLLSEWNEAVSSLPRSTAYAGSFDEVLAKRLLELAKKAVSSGLSIYGCVG